MMHYCEDGARALFFVNSLGGGGAERVCVNLASALSAKGIECDFVTLYRRRAYQASVKSSNVVCLDIDETGSVYTRMLGLLKALSLVNRFVKEQEEKHGRYGLITSHLQMSHVLAKLSCVSNRTIYVMHGAQWPNDPTRSRKYKAYLRAVYGKRTVSCVSEGLRSELVDEYDFDPSLVKVAFNPVPQPKSDPSFRPSISGDYILMVGRLNKLKRVDRAIRLFEDPSINNKYSLAIAGDGELRKDLEDLVCRLRLQNKVFFLGYQDDPYSWMANSSAVLSTSDSEAFPVAPVEALLLKVPVILSDCDYGPREILVGDLRNYLVNPLDDLGQYRKAIHRLRNETYPFSSFDKDSVDADKVCDRYLEMYRQLYFVD